MLARPSLYRHDVPTAGAVRQRRYRARLDAGTIMVTIPVDAALVDLLIRLRYLPAREHHSRGALADAIVRMHRATIA